MHFDPAYSRRTPAAGTRRTRRTRRDALTPFVR